MKVSLVIPVYYNEENLRPLYSDLKEKFIDKIDFEYEIVMVNDGSGDSSYKIMRELKKIDKNIKTISLSRNFGSHAAILCGLSHSTGDVAVVKAADLQEPTELIFEMLDSWRSGNRVVLAVREGREESKSQSFFANFYYTLVRKTALPSMPKGGFDVYLLDRSVIEVLERLDEKNSALTAQILWSGFKTGIVYYRRLAREAGKSRWTFKKKLRLVKDTLFSFTSLPISVVTLIGTLSVISAAVWGIYVFISYLYGNISAVGWTSLFIFSLLSFGIIMSTLGILGEYLWRTFDASRARPTYIIEDIDN